MVTDVSLKRKIRNYVTLDKDEAPGYAIYMQEKAVLNNQHRQAYKALNIEPVDKKLPKDEAKAREITAWLCKNFFDEKGRASCRERGWHYVKMSEVVCILKQKNIED